MTPDRHELMQAGEWLDSFYRSVEGLQRPSGLMLTPSSFFPLDMSALSELRIDWEGVAAWLFDVYIAARRDDLSIEAAKQAIIFQIQQTDEWKVKHPAPAPTRPDSLAGAFCIPDALFGDRLWWPNFLNEPEQRQDEIIRQTLRRGYNHGEVQVSGVPYPGYPEIPLDATLLAAGLRKMRAAGLQTVVAFRDDRGPDLSYLRWTVDRCADLIDWCMGIYECNGVFKDPAIVLDMLKQCRALLPRAKLAVHFTAQDPQSESHGLVDWQRAKTEANLNAYFFQVSGWLPNGLEWGIVRIADFTRRFMHGLGIDVYDFENTTSKTFRNEWTEAQGVAFTDALMNAPLVPDPRFGNVMSVRPAGFCDGGSI